MWTSDTGPRPPSNVVLNYLLLLLGDNGTEDADGDDNEETFGNKTTAVREFQVFLNSIDLASMGDEYASAAAKAGAGADATARERGRRSTAALRSTL